MVFRRRHNYGIDIFTPYVLNYIIIIFILHLNRFLCTLGLIYSRYTSSFTVTSFPLIFRIYFLPSFSILEFLRLFFLC